MGGDPSEKGVSGTALEKERATTQKASLNSFIIDIVLNSNTMPIIFWGECE
jgi:hypothetical protein